MLEEFVYVFILIALAASIFRDDAVFTLLYLLIGVYLIGRWWSHRGVESIRAQRTFPERVFLGEEVPIELEVKQGSWLPLVWLHIHEHLPQGLGSSGTHRQVVTLGPKGRVVLHYQLSALRRGYYQIGPLKMSSGDPFGISGEFTYQGAAESLIIYPRVVQLNSFGLPSRSPMGTLKHHLPIYEDPTRIMSKRDYVAGDSLRRIDWKASAAVGKLQVKQYEPSIALETMLLLNLKAAEFDLKARYDAPELGIIIAASIANWVVQHQQSVGLSTNGLDPEGGRDLGIGIGRGGTHLMRVLELLARIEVITPGKGGLSFLELVRQQRGRLPWGATLVLITGSADEALFDEIFQARRNGLNPVIVLAGNVPGVSEAREKAVFFNIPFYHIQNEMDLDQWRKARPGLPSPAAPGMVSSR